MIVADFVSFDLQGHTITGPGIQRTWSYSGIYTTADASGKQAMTARIRNGCITNFDVGVAIEGTGHLVEQMRVVGNMFGISFATHGHKRHMTESAKSVILRRPIIETMDQTTLCIMMEQIVQVVINILTECSRVEHQYQHRMIPQHVQRVTRHLIHM